MTIQDLKNSIIAQLHGTTLNQIYDINGTLEDVAGHFLADVDPQETKRIAALANPIFDQIYDYALPSDVKGNRIIDIRPQANRQSQDYLSQSYNRQFDYSKNKVLNPQFSVQFNSGVKTIRISDPLLNTGILINQANVITDSGIWVASGDASNLRVDNSNYVAYGGSLETDLATSGSNGYLTNSTFTAVDLTTHLNQSTLFLYVYLPDASHFTNIVLKWGSDNSNYWTATATTTYQGNAFSDGWNLCGFVWSSATKVSSPNVAKIGYVQVDFVYDGTLQTGARLNSIISRLGKIWEIEYYSKYLFRNASTNAFSDTISSDSDLINLDTESYHLFEHLAMYHLCQQIAGYSAQGFDAKFFLDSYNEALKRYKSLYKSEVILPKSTYYAKPDSSYNRFFGTRTYR